MKYYKDAIGEEAFDVLINICIHLSVLVRRPGGPLFGGQEKVLEKIFGP